MRRTIREYLQKLGYLVSTYTIYKIHVPSQN